LSRAALVFVTVDDFGAQPADQREALALQGFTAQVGSCAIGAGDPTQFILGLGAKVSPEHIRRAITALPAIPSGTQLEVTGLKDQHLVIAVTALRERGLVATHPDPSADDRAQLVAEAVQRARGWTNAPGAELFPQAFADVAHEVASAHGLQITVLDADHLRAEGFGGITAIGQGSMYPPQLIDLRYRPAQPAKRISLVGKGITFDTGGLSMKSPAAMMGMRMDKAGAAAVLATMSVLERLQAPVEVRALLPMAENMVGPQSVRPGDVVTARGGKTMQIMDTDFEGRVVMADAIAYAGEESPDAIVDIATLTYQVAIALGNDIGGIFSNDDALAADLQRAAQQVGEPLWRLPLAEQYLDQVRTATGVKNHPESDVGRAITAALLLREFVPSGIAWAHLDLTGPAWVGKASAAGATGFGVRTLIDWLAPARAGAS
jgi:leucyl aminopeptidase